MTDTQPAGTPTAPAIPPDSAAVRGRRQWPLPKLAVPLGCWYLISWILYGRSRIAREFLTTRPLRFLGRVSYSLYLLHPPFLYVSQYFVMISMTNSTSSTSTSGVVLMSTSSSSSE